MRDELLDTIPIRGNVEVAEPISDAQRIPGSENIVQATRRGDAVPIPKIGGGFSRITATGGAPVVAPVRDEDKEWEERERYFQESHDQQAKNHTEEMLAMREEHVQQMADLEARFADLAASLGDDDDGEHEEDAKEAAAAAKAKADKKPDKK